MEQPRWQAMSTEERYIHFGRLLDKASVMSREEKIPLVDYLNRYGLLELVYANCCTPIGKITLGGKDFPLAELSTIERFAYFLVQADRWNIDRLMTWQSTKEGHNFWCYHDICHGRGLQPEREAWGKVYYNPEECAWLT